MMGGGISDQEISLLTKGHSVSVHDKLLKAAASLNFSLKHIQVGESWRELLDIFRAECVGPWINLEIDGAIQRAFVDSSEGNGYIHEHDFRYINLGPQLKRLHLAMLEIETFDGRMHDSIRMRSFIGALNGGLHSHDQKAKALERIQSEYIPAKRGVKKNIKALICNECDIHERTFDNYVREVKNGSSSQ